MVGVIPSDLEPFVQQQVTAGEYGSPDEVVIAGLQILRELKRRQAEFREAVQAGVEELDRGEGIKVAAGDLREFFDGIQAYGRRRYEESKRIR